jgi:hypothetical protein
LYSNDCHPLHTVTYTVDALTDALNILDLLIELASAEIFSVQLSNS